jgi:arylformamidase
VVVRATERGGRAVDADAFSGIDVSGRAVLVHTGHAAKWGTDAYFEGHPYLTRSAAEHLRDAGAVFVGIDTLNIDDTDDGTRPVHSALLRADIPICEHMRGLELLPDAGFRFFAVPVKVKAFGTFPVRAFAILPS